MDNDNRIIIFDTTLRDGEQSPGASMNREQKVRMARMLEHLRVDVIEAGFPIASENDFQGVVEISKAVTSPIVCALARSKEADIDAAAGALQSAQRKRIHTFIATSPLHMEYKLHMSADAVLAAVTRSVKYARNLVDDVEWSAEDATRSNIDFLCRCIEAAIRAGATTINIPDTVGYSVPMRYGQLIQTLMERVPNSDKAVFSTHCHNDLGLALANSLQGVVAGARQVECTVNGVGERAGNAALEEFVMALHTRNDVLPYYTNVKTRAITLASRLTSAVTGFVVQPNKAIVGRNTFAHAAGIHQDGMLKNRETYEIMKPEDIGLTGSELTLSRHSGRAAVRYLLAQEGYEFNDDTFAEIFARFEKQVADKKVITVFELLEVVEDRKAANRGPYVVTAASGSWTAARDGVRTAHATVTVEVFGKELPPATATSNIGVIDACIAATAKAFSLPVRLVRYEDQSLGEGTDTMRKSWVTLERDGVTAQASATDTDTATAALKAYVHALNELHRTAPTEETIERPGHAPL